MVNPSCWGLTTIAWVTTRVACPLAIPRPSAPRRSRGRWMGHRRGPARRPGAGGGGKSSRSSKGCSLGRYIFTFFVFNICFILIILLFPPLFFSSFCCFFVFHFCLLVGQIDGLPCETAGQKKPNRNQRNPSMTNQTHPNGTLMQPGSLTTDSLGQKRTGMEP